MPDIFISYAREDRDTAEHLAHALEAEGWSVWWDRHIPAGKRFDEVISASLDSAMCVVVLWSQAGIASQWVAEEAEEGKERAALVPALIEAVEPPLGFRRIHAADLIGWDGDPAHAGLRRMIGDICQIMSTPVPSADAVLPASDAPSVSLAPARRTLPTVRRWRPPLIVAACVLLVAAVIGAFLVASDHAPSATEVIAARIDGRWQGQVAYDWGLVQTETFTFRTLGQSLAGSASFLGVTRAMLNPRLDGDAIRFEVRWQETLGSGEREVVNRYQGAVSGDRIDMSLSIEGGFSAHPPIEFAVARASN